MSLLSDRAALLFFDEKSFKKFFVSEDFIHVLRWYGYYDFWLQTLQKNSISSPMIIDDKSLLLIILFRNAENVSKKYLASLILVLHSTYCFYDIKSHDRLSDNILNWIIPALGYTIGVKGDHAGLVEIGDKTKEEIEVDNEFESLLSSLGTEFIKSRGHAWELVNSGKEENIKNAIDDFRRLFDEILRKIAPDDVVISSKFYDRKKHTEEEKKKPFRVERVKFVLAKDNCTDEELKFIESFSKLVSDFYEFVNSEVHILENRVKEARFIFIITEKLLYLLLTKNKEK